MIRFLLRRHIVGQHQRSIRFENGLHTFRMVSICLLFVAGMSTFCVSLTSAASPSLSDTLIFRHGRSRVRHSSEKNHIRWGLKAFDNLTLIDYDYENSNSSNGSNETMYDGGSTAMNTTNQSIFDNDGVSPFSLAYYSAADRMSAGGGGWPKSSSTSPAAAASSQNRPYNNNWTTGGGWTTMSAAAYPRVKLAKKQIMENIRKDVEEGIVYLRTHAHLLQPTESMPSEKLRMPPLPEPLTTASTQHESHKKLTPTTTESIIGRAGPRGMPLSSSSLAAMSVPMSTEMHTNKNMRKRFPSHFGQVKDATVDDIIQNQNIFSQRNSGSGDASEKANGFAQSMVESDASTVRPPQPTTERASLKIEKTSFDHVNDDEKHNLNGNLASAQSPAEEENATGDKFNINLNNKFEYNSEKHQPEEDALKGSFAPVAATQPSPMASTLPPPSTDPSARIDSKKIHSDKIERKQHQQQHRQVNPAPAKFQSETNDATLNIEAIDDVTEDNNNVSNNLQSNSDGGGIRDNVHLRIHSSFNLYSSDDGDSDGSVVVRTNDNVNDSDSDTDNDNIVVVTTAANDSEQTENEIIFPTNNDDDDDDDGGDNADDSDFERNINFDLTNDNLNDITPAIYRMDAIELAQMNEMDETSRRNRLKMMKGKDVVTEFLQIVERSMDNNCSAGTAVNLGEGVVDQYAQERFRVKADVAVNRANMLTRIFKSSSLAVQASEHILHASVLSMVEFDDDIFAAGHCFDWNQHTAKAGLYCPFAYRLPDQAVLAKDLALEYHYLGNTSEWFFLARQNAEKVINKNEQYIKAYHLYTNSTEREVDEILSVKYEDGRWSKPYYDCGGGNIWMLTYTVPFFGYENETYFFKGTSGIDIDLRRVDIDQCPQRQLIGIVQPLNIFAGTDKCKQRTTECVPISGLGFRRGSYKCVCRKGFYFPETNMQLKYFNGSTLEEEYEKFMLGEVSIYANPNSYECLPCAEGCDACKDASPCVAALNWPMRTIILALACAVIGFLPPAAWFTFRYQHVKVLRAASPALLRVIALGAFFIYCTSIVMYPPPSIYTCTARIWLREIGFSLTYGALMLKTWRISVIFRVRSAKAVKITDAALLKRLGIICGCIGIGLLVRTIVAPPLVIVGRTADDLKAYLCKTDWWDHTFTSMEVLFLAWGVRLCIMVRKAPSEFNESRFISMAIYNEFLLTCFLNVSMLFLQSPANPDLLYIIIFCHTQLTVTLLLALIFGSKVFLVFRSGGKPTDEHIGIGAKTTGVKFISRSHARPLTNSGAVASPIVHIGTNIEGHLTEEQALDEIRDLCVQLQKLRERMPNRGTAVTMVSTLLEQCKVSSQTQLMTIANVKKVDPHSNGSNEMFKPKNKDGTSNATAISRTCSKNDIEDKGAHNTVGEQMRCGCHSSQVNGNATIATCPTHICTTADVCNARGDGASPLCSSDCHTKQLLSPQSRNQQSFEGALMENANANEHSKRASPPPSASSPPSAAASSSSRATKKDLDFSNLKLRCMCSEKSDETADINESASATATYAPCLLYHRCETPDCSRKGYLIRRCCYCRRTIHKSFTTGGDGPPVAAASAPDKSLNVAHSFDDSDEVGGRDSSAHSSLRRRSFSENCNLKLNLSPRKSDKICRCECEHCHNNQSYCDDDGTRKDTCHCMPSCDFDLDRMADGARPDGGPSIRRTVIIAPECCGLTASSSGARASTAADRICEKCDKSLAIATTTTVAHDDSATAAVHANAETASSTTTTDTDRSAGDGAAAAEDPSTAATINNSTTNEKRNKTSEKLVLDLNDRSKYTKEVSV